MAHHCRALVTLFVLLFAVNNTFAQTDLPTYQPTAVDQQTLTSVGSDSMGGLMQVWVDTYRNSQPRVDLNVTSLGSATAPAALIDGVADIGPMARPMKDTERENFMSRYGFEPTQFRAALAGVAVYVSEKNPLSSITIDQLDSIYSADSKRHGGVSLTQWSNIGVSGSLGKQQILAIGRHKDSYAHSYFRQRVMLQSEFAKGVLETADSRSLLDTVAVNEAAIAFGEVVESMPKGVKMLAIAPAKGEQAVKPDVATMANGTYPLSRFLNVYVVRYPGKPVEPATADFLRFVLSQQGQQIVAKQGLTPLPAEVVMAERKKLE